MAGRRPLLSRSVNGISIGGLALVLALAVAGCGGGESKSPAAAVTTPAGVTPKPAEPAATAVARLASAARAGDCSTRDELFDPDVPVTERLCRGILAGLNPVVPPQVKTYGSGAVAKDFDGGHTVLALDDDGRFKFVISFSSPKLPTAPIKNADESMSRVVGAIRRDSCEDLLPYSLGKGKKYCAGSPIRQLHAALDRAYTASPKLLGGDGRFVFYGLKVKPDYFTLVFLASTNGQFFFVTSARG
jgi:hypothetical protein